MNDSIHRETSDRSLLRRIGAGEQDAATKLYMRYARRLARLAQSQTPASLSARVDPDDVVQSVFRTFFRRVALGQYDIPAGEDLWKLLLVMSLNKIRALGTFHRAAKRSVASTTELSDSPDPGLIASDESALRILELTVTELLQELPEAHRAIIELRIEGHDVAEIARRTTRSKRTVERVLQDFRQRLASQVDSGSESSPPPDASP